jgi:hypothetical protein
MHQHHNTTQMHAGVTGLFLVGSTCTTCLQHATAHSQTCCAQQHTSRVRTSLARDVCCGGRVLRLSPGVCSTFNVPPVTQDSQLHDNFLTQTHIITPLGPLGWPLASPMCPTYSLHGWLGHIPVVLATRPSWQFFLHKCPIAGSSNRVIVALASLQSLSCFRLPAGHIDCCHRCHSAWSWRLGGPAEVLSLCQGL